MISRISYSTPLPMENVIDGHKGRLASELREELESQRTELVNICLNFTADFNKSSLIRASSAFLARSVYLVGKKRINMRGTVGLHHLEDIRHSVELAPVVERLIEDGYTVYPVSVRSAHTPTSVFDVSFPARSAFIYGEEGLEIFAEAIELCNGPAIAVNLPGATRALNTAQSAAVLMAEYNRQHRQLLVGELN